MAEDINSIKREARVLELRLGKDFSDSVSKVVGDLAEHCRQQEFIINDLQYEVKRLKEVLDQHNIS